jgi:hypothetical protein
MAEKSFVFVFVKDRSYASPAPYLLEYVRFRHATDPRHKVLSVQDAITIMLNELQAGDAIREVHIYSHSNQLGYVWGRLRFRDRYQGISHIAVLQFQRTDKNARTLAKFGNKHSIIYVHGCNLGKSPEALRYWRDLFGGQKGRGIAPKLFQHFGLLTLTQKAYWRKKVFYEKEIQHTNDITEYVNSAVAEAKRRGFKLRADAEEAFKTSANKDLDEWLTEQYDLLRKGGELPSNMNNLSLEQIKTQMRDIFGAYHGILATFLFGQLRETWWPNKGNLRKIMKLKGAIFPEDSRWKTYYHTEPPQ